MKTVIRGARVVTAGGSAGEVLRGARMSKVEVRDLADVVITGGVIEKIVPRTSEDQGSTGLRGAPAKVDSGTKAGAEREIEARGRVVMAGFVDCHTHACFAGDRSGEWVRQMRGESYLDILRSGGGIMATVRAVRTETEESLAEMLRERLDRMLRHGSTTIEVKSGYGLTTEHELKMLRAIARASKGFAGTVVATALLGHAIDPEVGGEAFVERTIRETLPAVSAEFPGIAVDAYCEASAWSIEQCTRLFEGARKLGHPIRVHADQFTSMGMVERAIGMPAGSVDHLEASTQETVRAIGSSATIGVVLPVCGVHLGKGFAPGRALIDAGAALAVATNFNPGSAPCPSMQTAAAMAVRGCGMTVAEAIVGMTANAAGVLGLADRGRVLAGQRADLVILSHRVEAGVAHEIGGNGADAVFVGGELVSGGGSARESVR